MTNFDPQAYVRQMQGAAPQSSPPNVQAVATPPPPPSPGGGVPPAPPMYVPPSTQPAYQQVPYVPSQYPPTPVAPQQPPYSQQQVGVNFPPQANPAQQQVTPYPQAPGGNNTPRREYPPPHGTVWYRWSQEKQKWNKIGSFTDEGRVWLQQNAGAVKISFSLNEVKTPKANGPSAFINFFIPKPRQY